jgi:hypothetical protein
VRAHHPCNIQVDAALWELGVAVGNEILSSALTLRLPRVTVVEVALPKLVLPDTVSSSCVERLQ